MKFGSLLSAALIVLGGGLAIYAAFALGSPELGAPLLILMIVLCVVNLRSLRSAPTAEALDTTESRTELEQAEQQRAERRYRIEDGLRARMSEEIRTTLSRRTFNARNMAFDAFHTFRDGLADGSLWDMAPEDVEEEYLLLAEIYKRADIRKRQADILEAGKTITPSADEYREHNLAELRVKDAEEAASAERKARNRLIGRVHRAQKRLIENRDPDMVDACVAESEEWEAKLEENRKTGRKNMKRARAAQRELDQLEYDLLDRWVPPEGVGHDPVVDEPMPQRCPPTPAD